MRDRTPEKPKTDKGKAFLRGSMSVLLCVVMYVLCDKNGVHPAIGATPCGLAAAYNFFRMLL